MRIEVPRRGPARGRLVALALLLLVAGCATRTPAPTLPTTLRYPDFVYPVVPAALERAPGAERVDTGWRYLQNGDLRNAEREFEAAVARNPGLYPAHAGAGYVAVARDAYEEAVASFDEALRGAPDYLPALLGRGRSLLALGRDAEALTTLEAALAADPTLEDTRRRVEVLRFRDVQQTIEDARAAAAAGRAAEARTAYERALAASPDSAFLYRELAEVERRAGDTEAALQHFRRAAELDPFDAASLEAAGDLLLERQDLAGAEAAYRKAAAIEASEGLDAKIAALTERARTARLPAEFRAIEQTRQLTRGELAALIGIELEQVLAAAPPRQVVVTDTAGHWASPWITTVARAGVIDPFENHTFQPRAVVRRGDLAAAVSRVVALLAARDPQMRRALNERPRIADMNAGHLSYPAAAVAVAAGVLPLDDGRFDVNRVVSGAEALAAVDRLRALARN